MGIGHEVTPNKQSRGFDASDYLLKKLWSHFTNMFNGNKFVTTVTNHGFVFSAIGSR